MTENKRVSLKVTGPDGTEGTTVIRLGKVLEGPYSVTFDGQSTTDFEAMVDQVLGEASVRLVYQHSTHEIVVTGTNVVPEFAMVLLVAAAIGGVALITRGWQNFVNRPYGD